MQALPHKHRRIVDGSVALGIRYIVSIQTETGSLYDIRPGNGSGLFYRSTVPETHTGKLSYYEGSCIESLNCFIR